MINSPNKENVPKNKTHKALKIIGKIILGILVFLFLVVLFIRSPWGQNIIINKAVSFVSNKTNTTITLKKLFITFDGDIKLDGLYLEDTKGDTLLYSKSLEANIPIFAMLRGKGLGVDALDWDGLRANIIRKDSISGYNFQFLIDAFASKDSTVVQTDSTTAPLNLILKDLHFENLDIVFNDAVAGIDSRFKIGRLHADFKKTDLERMAFEASSLKLNNSNIRFIQKPVPKAPNPEPATQPLLSIKKIQLTQVYADYQSLDDGLAAEVDFKDFYAEIPNIDLPNNTFELNALNLKNSSIILHTATTDNTKEKNAEDISPKESGGFEWPKLNIVVKAIDFQNNTFSYFVDHQKAETGHFNPKAMVWTNFNILGNHVLLKDRKAEVQIKKGSVKEISGLELKTLRFGLQATDAALKINNLKTAVNNHILEGNLQLDYPTLSNFIQTPETSKVNLNLSKFQVALNDLFLFQPHLKKNEIFKSLSTKPITGHIKATGYLSDIAISSMKAHWGNTTHFSAQGHVKNITDADNLQLNIPKFSLVTKRSDIVTFVNEKETGLRFPNDVTLAGYLKGKLNNLYTDATLTTSQGLAKIKGHLKNDNILAFDADLSIEDYKLNELLQNPKIGALHLTVKASGKGKTINNLDAKLEANVSNLRLNNYSVQGLQIKGDIKNGRGKITSNYKDKNLNTDFYAFVVLDSVAPKASIKWDITGADLQALGVLQRPIKTGMKIYADFKGHATGYDVAALVDEGVVVYDNKTYLMGDINTVAHVRTDTTSVTFNNKLLNLDLQSNTNPQAFSSALQRHINSYFYQDIKIPDSIASRVNLKLRGHMSQAPVLKDVFLVNLKDMDTVKMAVDFDEKARQLKANVTAPHINYSGFELDSFAFAMDTDKEKFSFDLGFLNIKAGTINIQKTVLKGSQSNTKMAVDFIAYHKKEKLIQMMSEITSEGNQLRFHVLPEGLIFNKQPWNTPENNEILLDEKKWILNDFKFTKGNQSFGATDKHPSKTKDHIAINFKNFKLSEFLNYLNPDKKLATGNLNGNFIIEDPFTNTGIVADLDIAQLSFMDVSMGTLHLDAKSLGGNSYGFHADMEGGEINLDLKGEYLAKETGAELDLELDINKFNITALKGFSRNEITETEGYFTGNFKLSGTTSKPKYEGKLNFKKAGFKLAMFNAGFLLPNETLNVNNDGVSMDRFTIQDENKNSFTLSGNIGTKSFINPTFDLRAKADNFQFLNAEKEDNDFLYGKARFDADAKITGDMQIPKVNMTLTVGSDTDITYVLPSAAVNIEERDGVVLFVNRENPDAILTRSEEKTSTITGFDIAASLKIKKDAAISLIINEETGDNFKVAGEGDFDFKMNPNGNMTLAGVYEVKDGHYELNLYNLVSRKFNLASGSRVTWSGDPFDAKMDIKALYKVEASASSLMAPVSSGGDVASKGKFRQVLPFYVYLNIDGQLMEPKIGFTLDMPEEDKGAIGGQVYGRVQQLNQQEDELNRQVFSLLVLNRFYPDPGSDGSSGGVASIARDNLNDAVSDQLNMFSDKLLGKTGFELDFGLDSYTDYQGAAPQERTQLDIAAQKKLFNDRLIVRVGSEVDIQGSSATEEETPLIGNVSLEYLLSENGRYRLKGFRRNEFENVIDGQTIVSGISLIFTQEFNKFRELWEALLTSKTKEEEKEEAELKADKKSRKPDEEAETNESTEPKQP
ncbi:translocation/assembly module TamB domain-containing protein [Mariniflexile ostreae]|uniref:Translocation/assembly module TamB domain-containing protein n=1 Tax=Mariniflexile ostreae TaxID=1520892 RepID=A0ABV5FB80_9FLAO